MGGDFPAKTMVQEAVVTRIYADHAATTPLVPDAQVAMLPWLSSEFGNPSSLYEEGRRARAAIDQAREALSDALGCLFAEVLFTSSGTESANLAILGAALSSPSNRRRILFGAAEHHCVLHTQPILEKLGFLVELIPVDRQAVVNLGALEKMMADDVLLVSVMHANNELGTIQPIFQVAGIAHRFGALVHCDAVQTFTVWDWKVTDLDADIVTLSAHKLGGPKGVGAIYTRAGVKLQPLTVGGAQEREMRAGTENVGGIVGFGAVARKVEAVDKYVSALAFAEGLVSASSTFDVQRSTSSPTLPGHVHLRFPGVPAETLLIRLDRTGVSASAGSACSSGSLDPSHVMLACGYSEAEAKEGVRFSFGRNQPAEEGTECARRLLEAVAAIKSA